MTGPEVSLADLMLALERLAARDEDRQRRIAALLGLSRMPGQGSETMPSPTPPPARFESPPHASPPPYDPWVSTPGKRRPPPEPPAGDEPVPLELRPSSLETLSSAGRQTPPRLLQPLPELLGAPIVGASEQPGMPVAVSVDTSLFAAHWRRALLTTALSVPTGDGPIDAEAAVSRIATGVALTELPRLTLPTMRHGVQLLIDVRPGMRPYADDQQRMRQQVALVAGRDGLRVARFSGCPARGLQPEQRAKGMPGARKRRTLENYQPPPPRTPVLLLSDLGIGAIGRCPQRADEQEWLGFARLVRDHGNPLLALVPFPPSRWSRRLRRWITLIEWDRATGISDIRRTLGATS